jgi:hypothetical protein
MGHKKTQDAIDYAKRMLVRGVSQAENIGLMGDATSAFADRRRITVGTATPVEVWARSAVPGPGLSD